MTCYTTDQFIKFLFSYLPPWWSDENPVLEAILSGFGTISQFIYCNLALIKIQTRISTATGEFLDFIALDFFGNYLKRCPNESDTSFRSRILKEMLAPRVTRQAMIDRLTDLTGRVPLVFEAFTASGYYNNSFANHAFAGFNGPYQAWITAYRPIPPVQNTSAFANNTAFANANSFYGGDENEGLCVTDENILTVVDITKAAGTLMHVTIVD